MPQVDPPDPTNTDVYGDAPAIYALEKVELSQVEAFDGTQRGFGIVLDLHMRASGETHRRGVLILLTPPMGAELAGELLDAADKVWGNDFNSALRQRLGSRLTDIALRAL